MVDSGVVAVFRVRSIQQYVAVRMATHCAERELLLADAVGHLQQRQPDHWAILRRRREYGFAEGQQFHVRCGKSDYDGGTAVIG